MPVLRFDAKGFFYELEQPAGIKRDSTGSVQRPRILPSIPDTGWTLPTEAEFIPFSRGDCVSIDIETKDLELKSFGPGVRRGGEIVGVSVAVPNGPCRYYPVAHAVGENLELDKVKAYLRHEFSQFTGVVVGANLVYDLDYLTAHWGIDISRCTWYDVQVAEPLINESAYSYALDTLAEKYLHGGKVDEALYTWSARAYGGKPVRSEQAGNIWRCPPALVGPYAESDAHLPLQIKPHQELRLAQEELQGVFTVESELTPMLLAMRQRGCRVDLSSAQSLEKDLSDRAQEGRETLKQYGIFGPWNRDEIARYCDAEGIKYPVTAKDTPSFTSKFIEKMAKSNPVMHTLQQVRRFEKHGGTFVRNYISNYEVCGRLHGLLHQLPTGQNGAVSGRFACSHPNEQNIPARDEELGPAVRALWVPDEGEDWGCQDYSQIEFRLGLHYGKGPSADGLRARYAENPNLDYHQIVADWCGISRKFAKNINFGLVYGMGEPAMAMHLGMLLDQARPLFTKYHAELPFIRELFDSAKNVADKRGFVRTLLGRRRRFNLFEPAQYSPDNESQALPYDEAVAAYGRGVRRSQTRSALNAILQGGAADVIKLAMVKLHKSGVCNVLGVPLLQVHDELNWSVPRTLEGQQAFKEAERIMETVLELKVPLVVNSQIAANWGQAK